MVPITSYVKNYESHPGKTLSKHTLGVCEKAMIVHPDYRVRTASLFHDNGKLNPNFALKLKGKCSPDLYSNHSYLSLLSLLGYWGKHKYVPGIINNFSDLLIIAACVVKHHGSMPNFKDILNDEELNRLKDFLDTKPNVPVAEFLSLVKLHKDLLAYPIQAYESKRLKSLFGNRVTLNQEIKNKLKFFFDLRMSFSAVVASDKLDASKLKLEDKIHDKFLKMYPTKIEGYLKSLKTTTFVKGDLNDVRTEMREVAVSNLNKAIDLHPDQKLFSLTYPTGAGKTAIMLALASVISKKKGRKRIIYSVPFLSITEQIYDIIEQKAFGGDYEGIKRLDCKAPPIHDLDFDINEEANTILDKMKDLVRKVLKGKTLKDEKMNDLRTQDFLDSTFNYPLIVTTFVQFFQSFTTASNKGLMRFHSLKDCIFLIDEIQALTPTLYTFFVALIDAFCQTYDSYAILSTATMPDFKLPAKALAMFPDYKEPIEIGDLKFYDHPIFNRYEIKVLSGTFNTQAIASTVMRETAPTMVITNTIKASREVYAELKSLMKCKVLLMNTNFHALDRRRILGECKEHIEAYKKGETKEPFFLVCTQLVEAGVDIDFDVVYRDIAPLPNIIQAAGRCNRNGKLGEKGGKVYVFKMIDANNKNKVVAEYIYNGSVDGPFLANADQVFFQSGKSTFEEKELLNIQKGFFNFVNRNTLFATYDNGNLMEQINEHNYGDVGTYTVIPDKRYGIQEQFYIPESPDNGDFEKMIELMVEKIEADESTTLKDKYAKISVINKRNNEHVKKMRDRVVQANINPNINFLPFVEYSQPYFHLYKLKPGIYNSELGLSF